jgi:predicted nucleic acid-binding protein
MTDVPFAIRIVVTDANVLINLIHTDLLATLGRLPGYEFVVPDHVHAEVTDEKQRKALDAAIAAGVVDLVSVTDLAAIELYAELSQVMGSGEAACLALASTETWIVASDEKRRFRREALARLGEGRILTTPGLVLLAIRAGVLTVEEADAAKAVLETKRFTMQFASFRELLDN